MPQGAIRLAFVSAALCGGLGIVAYAACWLIIPSSGEPAPDELPGAAPAVVVAWAVGGLVAVVGVGAASAAATVFGLGYVVLVLATALLAASVLGVGWVRPAVTLLGVAALTLPAVAVALSPVRLLPSAGTVPIRIEAGLRRTIVVLPTDRWVRVRYHVHSFTGQLAALLAGRAAPPFSGVVVFGRL